MNTPQKTTIVFFAYNQSLINYVIKDVEKYLNQDFNVIVLHISNLTRDRSKALPNKEYPFRTIDISGYNSIKIKNLLKSISPKTIIFTTYLAYYDFLLFNIAKKLKISTIFHDHGLVFGGKSPQRVSFIKWQIIVRFLSFFKNLFFLFLVSPRVSIIKNFWKFFKQNFNFYSFDAYLIYSSNNLNHYSKILPINQNTIISGFPLFADDVEKSRLKNSFRNNKFLFVQQPFRKIDYSTATFDEEINQILELQKILSKYNFSLEVRLHPTEKINDYDLLLKEGVVFNTGNLIETCSTFKGLIGQWSTALISALPLNIPIYIIEFPKVKPEFKFYYNIFQDFGIYIFSMDEFEKSLLVQLKTHNFTYDQSLVKNFIGEDNTFEKNAKDLTMIINSFN
ncbi:MAG: hypothetical protein A2W98_01250 [Bacteroidetes bacterium GWF2_33_38]|nr:MAG: hypothetical protein A2W98_01250 [Bacteroidetes bacterium GWF2_33_38]OFY92190.1 MAG: hypothetical protein A2236_02905 [Bacteroidetes bacterium RIFOXYA2_FULL_33_7]HBX50579.1 hypothetical protein [Bacteroidales bacterium]